MLPSNTFVVSKDDNHGRSYGGAIALFSSHMDCPFSPPPRGPVQRPGDNGSGATFSTSQEVGSLAGATGSAYVNGSATAPPFVQALAGANGYFAISFEFGDLDQQASLAGVFDQYRFDKVELRFVPRDNAINTMNVAAPNATIPTISVVLDFDDAIAPTSLAYVRQYDNVQGTTYGDGVLAVTVRPTVTPAVWASGAFSGYAVQAAPWIDAASTSVTHFGVKGAITSLTGGSTQTCFWQVLVKYFVSFRKIH